MNFKMKNRSIHTRTAQPQRAQSNFLAIIAEKEYTNYFKTKVKQTGTITPLIFFKEKGLGDEFKNFRTLMHFIF